MWLRKKYICMVSLFLLICIFNVSIVKAELRNSADAVHNGNKTVLKMKRSVTDCAARRYQCDNDGSGDLCNGNGICICGKCHCGGGRSGKFCEISKDNSNRCEELKNCIQCRVMQTGEFDMLQVCESECVRYPHPNLVDIAEVKSKNEVFCAFTDHSDGCRFSFVYGYDEKWLLYLEAQRYKDCPPELPIFHIIAFVVGGALIIGLVCILICVVMYCFRV